MAKHRVNIMLDPDVITDVRASADRNRRSFSAQVQTMLEGALAFDAVDRMHTPNAAGPGPSQRLEHQRIPDPRPGHEGESLNAHYARYGLGLRDETDHLTGGR